MFLKERWFRTLRVEAKSLKKQLVIIGITLVLFVVGLSGCTSTEQQPSTLKKPEDIIIGTWYGIDNGYGMNFSFYRNNSVSIERGGQVHWVEYEITEDKIYLVDPTNGQTTAFEYSFTNNNQKLIVTGPDGQAMILTRK